jgi:hypothetical protein
MNESSGRRHLPTVIIRWHFSDLALRREVFVLVDRDFPYRPLVRCVAARYGLMCVCSGDDLALAKNVDASATLLGAITLCYTVL